MHSFQFIFSQNSGLDSSNSSSRNSNSTTMDTNILGTANSIWQNHCNGSGGGGSVGGGSGSSSSGTSQSSPVSINDLHEPQSQQQQQPIRKKTWSELKESVTELRKQLSRLSTMVPTNIQFRKLSDSRIRIYFLGMSYDKFLKFSENLHHFHAIFDAFLDFILNRYTAKCLGSNTLVHRHYTCNAHAKHTG